MKALILKDLYNLSNNIKSMIFIFIVFAVAFIPSTGAAGFIVASSIMCGMMIITTFSVDNYSSWDKYALIMPITKKDIVKSKCITLFIISFIGTVLSLSLGIVGDIIIKKGVIDKNGIIELLTVSLLSLSASLIFSSVNIPFIYKFGVENGRLFRVISVLIPTSIGGLIYYLLSTIGLVFTENIILLLIYLSPVIAFVWIFLIYKISYAIFKKKEL